MERIIANFERSFPFMARTAVSYKEGIFGELVVRLNDGSTVIYDDVEDVIRILNTEEGRLEGKSWADEFRRRIEKRLYFKGMTKAELADLTGINYQSLSNYMSGRTNPTISNLIRIADVLEYGLDDLANF